MVWLATLICVNLQTSFLTPPFGWALFFLRGVAPPEVTTGDIYRGIVPFVLMQILALVLCFLFPGDRDLAAARDRLVSPERDPSGEAVVIAQLHVRQDALTDPRDLSGLYEDLPDLPADLRAVVSQLIVHVSWATRYGIPPDVPLPRQTQSVADRLSLTQARFAGSLTPPRPPEKRTFGTCRDYALMLCSRAQGSLRSRRACGAAMRPILRWGHTRTIGFASIGARAETRRRPCRRPARPASARAPRHQVRLCRSCQAMRS